MGMYMLKKHELFLPGYIINSHFLSFFFFFFFAYFNKHVDSRALSNTVLECARGRTADKQQRRGLAPSLQPATWEAPSNIWELIGCLKKEQTSMAATQQQIAAGDVIVKRQRKYVALNARLNTLTQRYTAGQIAQNQFLDGVAHNLSDM